MPPRPSPVLALSESARDTMMAAASRANPYETGGILIGVDLRDGHPWVTVAIEIESDDRGRRHYKLPGGSTQPAVRAARLSDRRLGYLGDWHTHPGDSGPSPTDLATLARHSLAHPRRPNPTMIVVRNTEQGHVIDARRMVAVTSRPCEIRLMGDLPPVSLLASPIPEVEDQTLHGQGEQQVGNTSEESQ